MEMKAGRAEAVLLMRKSWEAIPLSLVFNALLLISKLGPRSDDMVFSETVRILDSSAVQGKVRQARRRIDDRKAAKGFISLAPFNRIGEQDIRIL
jgi:hypothetical protein